MCLAVANGCKHVGPTAVIVTELRPLTTVVCNALGKAHLLKLSGKTQCIDSNNVLGPGRVLFLVIRYPSTRHGGNRDSVEGHDQSCEASTPNAGGYRSPRYSNVRIAAPVVADAASCDRA